MIDESEAVVTSESNVQENKPRKQHGLRGQEAGDTALCTVGAMGKGLTYCGYDVEQLAKLASFEEVVYLLFYGELPSTSNYISFKEALKSACYFPDSLKQVLKLIPKDTHPMDVMRTACSFLGNLEPEAEGFKGHYDVGICLLASLPAALVYWYRYTHDNVEVETNVDADSIAEHFLFMLYGETPPKHYVHILNVSLILYAEHEFNASTFASRVCASTLSDTYSAVTAGIGTLRGILHGGANEAVMYMLLQMHSVDEALESVKGKLQRKEKIMGFGHAVYRTCDPRSDIIKVYAQQLAEELNDDRFFPIACAIEKLMWEEKRLFPNADFFHALAYHYMRIPIPLFTPIFVCSRVAGWVAHIGEQRSDNRIIRPSARYVGNALRPYVSINDR